MNDQLSWGTLIGWTESWQARSARHIEMKGLAVQINNTQPIRPLQDGTTCSVYIIGSTCRYDRAPWVYACKIGMADNVKKRLAQLQIGNPHPLSLILELKFPDRATAARVEARFHDAMEHSAIQGEWFGIQREEALDAMSDVLASMSEGLQLCL